MNHRFFSLLALLLLCLSIPAAAFASAAGKEFNDADAALNVAYKAVLAKLSNREERALFVESQRSWLKYRDQNVEFYALHYPESKGGLFYNTRLIKARTAFLKSLLTDSPVEE